MVTTKKTKRYLFPSEEEILLSSFDDEIEINNDDAIEEETIDSQTKIIKPEIFQDAKIAAEYMMNDTLNVLVDLSYIIKTENGERIAERIIDFLYGVSLPLHLFVTRINETTFIFSKEKVDE